MLNIKLPIYYQPIDIADDHKQLKKDFIDLCLRMLNNANYGDEEQGSFLQRKLAAIVKVLKKDLHVKLTIQSEDLDYAVSLTGNALAMYFKQHKIGKYIYNHPVSILAWFSELKEIQDSDNNNKILIYKLKDNWFDVAPVNHWFIEALILYYKEEAESLIEEAYTKLISYGQQGFVFKYDRDSFFIKVNRVLTNFFMLQGFRKDEIPVWTPPEPCCEYCVYFKNGKCIKHIVSDGFLVVKKTDVCIEFKSDSGSYYDY